MLFSHAARADYMDHFVVREDVGLRKAPYLGKAELVLLPVEVKGYPPLDEVALQKFFANDTEQGFANFHRVASMGRYQPRVMVAPKIVFDICPLPADKFPTCAVARGDLSAFTAGMNMIREVVTRAVGVGVDFSKLDVNGRKGVPDGFADGVMILTNTPFGGIAFPIGFFNRDDNLAGGLGGPLIVGGVKISHVAIAGNSQAFVLIHEFGHLLGLTDLYDESRRYAGLHLSVMGAWRYDEEIPLHDAETRFRLRWSNWHQATGRQRVTIPPVETSGVVWRLGTGSEYFLVENRGPGGTFDRHLTARGLAVFHVDRRVKLNGEEGRFVDRSVDCVNCDPWHPYLQWLQADGLFEVQQGQKPNYVDDLFRDGDTLKPDATDVPLGPNHRFLSTNRFDGTQTGISITDIKIQADQSIEVTFDAPTTGQCDETLCNEGDGCKPLSCGGSPAPGETTPPTSGCTAAPGALMAALAGVWLYLLKKRFSR